MDAQSIKYDRDAVYVDGRCQEVDFDKVYGDLRQKYINKELDKWDFIDAVHYRAMERNLGSSRFACQCMYEEKLNLEWLGLVQNV